LRSEEREAVEHALSAADETFARFQDDPSSHYYQAEGRTPEETWTALTHEVGRVTGIALTEASSGERLTEADFDALHRGIFGPVFGSAKTLPVRQFRQEVEFNIVVGERGTPENMRRGGNSAKTLPKTFRKIVKGLDAAFMERDEALREKRPRSVMDATRPAARAYGRLCAAHPWFDGNGRTAYPLLSFALVRLGIPAVAVLDTEDFQWCLGRAMLNTTNRDVEPLAEFLAKTIHSSDTNG
jgi:fido (protein-threonine AMPylation protein)